ncbi:hypothetical protein K8R47_03000 [archaeon]|nr:hypothetical protein [archaeon]
MYKKIIKRGGRFYTYYYYNFREGNKVKNICLGSDKKLAKEKIKSLLLDQGKEVPKSGNFLDQNYVKFSFFVLTIIFGGLFFYFFNDITGLVVYSEDVIQLDVNDYVSSGAIVYLSVNGMEYSNSIDSYGLKQENDSYYVENLLVNISNFDLSLDLGKYNFIVSLVDNETLVAIESKDIEVKGDELDVKENITEDVKEKINETKKNITEFVKLNITKENITEFYYTNLSLNESILGNLTNATYENLTNLTIENATLFYDEEEIDNRGLFWEFEVLQEDPYIYTEVEVINLNVLEITVKERENAEKNSPNFDMFLVGDEIDGLKYKEDVINDELILLEKISLPNKFEHYKKNLEFKDEGYLLTSDKNVNDLPKTFRIEFNVAKEKQFKLFTGSGTEVLFGTASFWTPNYMPNNEKIVKDSDGVLHAVYGDISRDIQYRRSSDDGETWDLTELTTGAAYNINLLINSTDGLHIVWAEDSGASVGDIYHMDSPDGGDSWSGYVVAVDVNGSRDRFRIGSAVMDDNDNIHAAWATLEWDDDGSNDWLAYFNYSAELGQWLSEVTDNVTNFTWVNSDSSDDTDVCDIETDSNGRVYIVGMGEKGDIDLWVSSDEWDGTNGRISIEDSGWDADPSIYIDKNDKIVVSYRAGSSANSTAELAETTWTIDDFSDTAVNYPTTKITDRGDIYHVSQRNSAYNKDVIMSWWNSTDGVWTKDIILKDNATVEHTGEWNNNSMPTTGGSRKGSSILVDKLYYMYFNDTDDSIYFDYVNITPPSTALLNVSWITPTVNSNVKQYELTNFSVNVSCIGDNGCGDVNVTLDPAGEDTAQCGADCNLCNEPGSPDTDSCEDSTVADCGTDGTDGHFFTNDIWVNGSFTPGGAINIIAELDSNYYGAYYVTGWQGGVKLDEFGCYDGTDSYSDCDVGGPYSTLDFADNRCNLTFGAGYWGSESASFGVNTTISELADPNYPYHIRVSFSYYSTTTCAVAGLGNGRSESDGDFCEEGSHGENDGINLTLSTGDTKTVISTTVGDTPFYTFDENPNSTSCIDMKDGDSCVIDWRVNATGNLQTNWTFFAYANSTNYTYMSNMTDTINITIVAGNVDPNNPVIKLNATNNDNLTNRNLITEFRLNDDDGDQQRYNITWYKNDVSQFTFQITTLQDNNTLIQEVLESGNTSSGETWKAEVQFCDDGDLCSAFVNSSGLIIGGGPQISYSYIISDYSSGVNPTFIYQNNTLTCENSSVVFSAGDVADVSFNYSWYKNGVLISGEERKTLGAGNLSKGNLIHCEIQPNVGYDINGTSVNSTSRWLVDTSVDDFRNGSLSDGMTYEGNGNDEFSNLTLKDGTYSAEFVSRIYDLGLNPNLTTINFNEEYCYNEHLGKCGGENLTGLVALLHLDEYVNSSNDVLEDFSGLNNKGVISANLDCKSLGKYSSFGCNFTGNSGYISIADSATMNPSEFTISFWFKNAAFQNSISLPRIISFPGDDFEIAIAATYGPADNKSLYFYDGAWTDTTYDAPLGDWIYLAFVYTGSEMFVFADGVLVHNSGMSRTLSGDLIMGCRFGGDECVNGEIDEFSFWNKTLTINEINDTYNLGINRLYVQTRTAESFTINDVEYIDWSDWSGEDYSRDKCNDDVDCVVGLDFSENYANTTYDNSGNGSNGTIIGASYTYKGKHGSALKFDGVKDFVNVSYFPEYPVGANFTYEAWIKTSVDNQYIMGGIREGGTNDPQVSICIGCTGYASDDNVLRVRVTDEDGGETGYKPGLIGSTVLTDNNWHHIAFVRDTHLDEFRIYVDGLEDGIMIDPLIGVLGLTQNNIYVGAWNNKGSRDGLFNGTIDSVAIYDRPLTPLEIYEHHLSRIENSSEVNLPKANRFFQYNFTFETDNSSSIPKLMDVTLKQENYINLVLNTRPYGIFGLTGPENNSLLTYNSGINFNWSQDDGYDSEKTEYQFLLDDNSDFSSPLVFKSHLNYVSKQYNDSGEIIFIENFDNYDNIERNNPVLINISFDKGKFGGGGVFNLDDDKINNGEYINYGDQFDIGQHDLTIEAWINTDNNSNMVILSKEAGSGGGYSLEVYKNSIMFNIYDSDGDWRNFSGFGSTISDNHWKHIAVVMDYKDNGNSQVEMYVNNSAITQGSFAGSGTPITDFSNSGNFIVGDGNGGPFMGSIDEVRITKGKKFRATNWQAKYVLNSTEDLDDGTYYWKVRSDDWDDRTDDVYERSLGEWNGTYVFNVDKSNPNIVLDSPTDYQNLSTSNVIFKYNGSDLRLDTCEVYGNWSDNFVVEEFNTNPNNYSWNEFFEANIGEGNYIWGVMCNDTLNQITWTSNYTFTIDLSSPNITDTNLTTGGFVVNETSFVSIGDVLTITAFIDDPFGMIANVWIIIWADIVGGDILYEGFMEMISPGVWQLNFTINESFSDGLYNISFFANDTVGWIANRTNISQTSGLVVYLPFDENNGRIAYDYSGLGNNGSLLLGVNWTNDGRYGSAVDLPNSIDFVSILGGSPISGDEAFTISAWVRPGSMDSYHGAVSFGSQDEARTAYIGVVDPGNLGAGWWGEEWDTGITPTINEWYYLVMTYAGGVDGAVKIYVDGVEKVSQTKTSDINPAGVAVVGGISNSADYMWDGSVDEVAIWNRSLSQTEVYELYAGGLTTQFLVNNTDPILPTPEINSTDGSNFTNQDLHCFDTLLDADADFMNATVRWYNNSVMHLEFDFNESYANGTAFSTYLEYANTSAADNWSCSIRLFDSNDYSGWGNSSNLTVIQTSVPNNPTGVILNSSAAAQTNYTTEILKANFLCDDPDVGDTLTYDISFYKEGIMNFSLFSQSCNDPEYADANLHFGNTTKYDNWSFSVNVSDVEGNSSATIFSNNLTIENSPPEQITLFAPLNDNLTTNRTPMLSWNQGTDNDGDDLTYNVTLICQIGCGVDNRDYVDVGNCAGGVCNYTIPNELLYFWDDLYFYQWAIAAYDTEDYGPLSSKRIIKSGSYVVMTVVTNSIDFGDQNVGGSDDTTDDNPLPFILRNDGNTEIEVNVSALNWLWDRKQLASGFYQAKVDAAEANSFNVAGSSTSFFNIPNTNQTFIDRFNHSDSNDEAEVDINIEVPLDEPAGNKSSQLSFTGYYVKIT